MTNEEYIKIAPTIPKDPGVYRYIDEFGNILYVGKAKNLKKRISSYFGVRKDQPYKTRSLVRNAHHIEFTIVQTEQDALLLENTLIKKHQPKYNVQLKDGKSYTYICIKKERFPRVSFTRRVIKDGSTYFGPFTSKYSVNILLEIIKQLFTLRSCTFNLSEKNIATQKFKVCLEYHIKNCNGPCENFESEDQYNIKIEQIKNILRGNFKQVKEYIKSEMKYWADEMNFEKAQIWKDKLQILNNYQAKSTVVSTKITNVDVFSIKSSDKLAYVNYIRVKNGAVINTQTIELKKNLNEEEHDLLAYIIPYLRSIHNSESKEILLPFQCQIYDPEIKTTIPKRGEKKKLIELSTKNLTYFLLLKKKENMNKRKKLSSAERILSTLKEDLHMNQIPYHIECFDNSNTQGTNPTASCIVFKNAKASKADYRHFKVKTVEGPDDFASMKEIVFRRYSRLLKENKSLPQLIIIDGGKGQLSSAFKSLQQLKLDNKITIIGIAKKLEEIYFPNDSIPLHINKKSESLKLIQQARDEAHRFALTLHRKIRSKNFISTQLTDIPGVGMKTAETLLKKYKSVNKVKSLNKETLVSTIGPSLGNKVYNYFHIDSNHITGKD